MARREASMMHQQVVETMTSPFSLGLNSSLLGRKWEPVFPGLLYNCIHPSTTNYIIEFVFISLETEHLKIFDERCSMHMHSYMCMR